jgi:hypothetical protein
MKLAVVTASTDLVRATPCLRSWMETATTKPELFVELNGKATYAPEDFSPMDRLIANVEVHAGYLGTVKAFLAGTKRALETDAEIICSFHDDLIINEPGWDDKTLEFFRRHPGAGLVGFGGAIGLADDDIGRKPFAPVQLARKGFRSNLVDAEVHGLRSTLAERVACLDAFSMIFRRDFAATAWADMDRLGIVHHFQDGAAACLAARAGLDVWYLPVACQHLGGRTAVGDAGYQTWAKAQIDGGDQGFWQKSHEVAWQEFKNELPIRV